MKRPRVPIVARVLVLNALLVFLPVAAFLSLDTYERNLLAALEESLVQQGRFLAAWLGEGELSSGRANDILASLEKRHTARLRVLDAAGNLLADSSLPVAGGGETAPAYPPESGRAGTPAAEDPPAVGGERERAAEASWIYRLLSRPVRLYRRYLAPPAEPLASADFYAGKRNFLEGTEVRAALEGRYGAATRISAGGQVSVTLYSALPVPAPTGEARGVVLASQSTYRILAGLYRLRLDVGRIFLASLAASSALSLLLWLTISRPLARLGAQARAALSLQGLASGHFGEGAVSDEIGDLAVALREFSSRLGERLSWAEDFAADLAHEIRNPLASIRAATELLDAADEVERRDLADRIARDTDRVDRVVGGLRELSRIEGGEGDTGSADVLETARNSAERAASLPEALAKGLRFTVHPDSDSGLPRALIAPDRLALALGTLLDNAVSFSPQGAEIEIHASPSRNKDSPVVLLSVLDRGPGIPLEHRERIFDRFFSFRPEGPEAAFPTPEGAKLTELRSAHCGLGLALVRSIALRARGRAEAAARPGGGAILTLSLPAAAR